jgi:outer membrane protein
MGDINGAAGLKLFGSYNFGRLIVSSALTKYDGSDNKGLIADVGANLPFRLSQKLTVTAHVGATWANDQYMQTFFGVTPVQSADSGYSEFTAHAGLKDVDAGFRADYRLDQHWFVSTSIGVKRLEGDAAKSPITFANTEGTFMTVLSYHF